MSEGGHHFGIYAFCKRCGVPEYLVFDGQAPAACAATDNVVALSERLAERRAEALMRRLGLRIL